MIQKEAIDKLRKEALVNPVANAVLHVFTLRKRARSELKVDVLAKIMAREKFSFSREEYVNVLKSLSEAGVGHLVMDAKGKVRGIKDVRVTFKSLGEAVCLDNGKLEGFTPRKKYSKVPKRQHHAEVHAEPTLTSNQVGLVFSINKKPVSVNVPDNMTANDVAELVMRFKSSTAS